MHKSMDQDLTRRLAILRHSLEEEEEEESLIKIPKAGNSSKTTYEDPLIARFAKMSTQPQASITNHSPSEEKMLGKNCNQAELPLQELIDALNSEKESWTLKKWDENEIENILAEAAELIPEFSEIKYKHIGNQETTLNWFQNVSMDVGDNSDTEADILNMIKDEINFESAHGIVSTEEDKEDPDKYLLKRFGALGSMSLPPAPKCEPGINPMQKFPVADAETDTWCCICNENAEYRCSGCENDIYCASCLYEGHTGPNAGYEERRHKWTKYIKPQTIAES